MPGTQWEVVVHEGCGPPWPQGGCLGLRPSSWASRINALIQQIVVAPPSYVPGTVVGYESE